MGVERETVNLTLQHFSKSSVLTDLMYEVNPVDVELRVRDVISMLAKDFNLRASFWSERLEPQVHTAYVEVPNGWWEAFKKERLPDWFTNRYPVKTKNIAAKVNFTPVAVYPKLALPRSSFKGDKTVRFIVESQQIEPVNEKE